jgi:hypothetical protein
MMPPLLFRTRVPPARRTAADSFVAVPLAVPRDNLFSISMR